MIKKKSDDAAATIEIQQIQMVKMDFCVLGSKPLLMNRLGEKARQELLLPARKKNRAEREITPKHDPIAEYRSALNQFGNDDQPTRIYMPGRAFALAIASAALDIPGASKSEISRLVQILDPQVNIFGIPQMHLDIVRLAGITKVPDVRTRAIFPRWAAKVSLRYMKNRLNSAAVANLFGAAGILIGIGDYRLQKSGSFGEFNLVSETDAEWQRIVTTEGREAQDSAIADPTCYDIASEELYTWFQGEAARREKTVTKGKGNGAKPAKNRVAEFAGAEEED